MSEQVVKRTLIFLPSNETSFGYIYCGCSHISFFFPYSATGNKTPKWLCGSEKNTNHSHRVCCSAAVTCSFFFVDSLLVFSSSTPRSPMSCLPLLFDQRDGLGAGVRARPENVPPASSHIELLLEKHGNGEMGVNSEWGWIRCILVVPKGFQDKNSG